MPPQQAGLLYSPHVGVQIAMKGCTSLPAAHQFHLRNDKQETNSNTNTNSSINGNKTTPKKVTPQETLMALFPCFFQFKKAIVGRSIQEEEIEEVGEEEKVERHVRFAGEVVERWEDNDGCILGSFADAVDIIEIPHVSEYTKEDKRTIWYTGDELMQMKLLCLQTVSQTITNHRQKHNCSAVESLYCCSFFLRGLEKFIDYHQIMNNNDYSNTSDNYVLTKRTNIRRYDSIISVLNEQYNQRVECLQKHGMVCRGVLNPDQLKDIYQIDGQTQESLCDAQCLAKNDETDVKEYNSREEFESSSSLDESSLSSSSSYHYSPDDNVDNDDENHFHHHNNTNNGCTNDNNIIHNILVKSVLRKLITPFVKVPLGNIFLGINHTEC